MVCGMKTGFSRILVAVVWFGIFVVLPFPAYALRDDFDGASVDASLWTTSLPFPSGIFGPSALNEAGGSLTFVNRGTLITKEAFSAVDITGRFTITGEQSDKFKIVLRTDGSFCEPYAESANGIAVRFGHIGYNAYNVEFEQRETPSNGIALANAVYPIALNTAYDFRITDDGSTIDFYIGDLDTPLLSATTAVDSGDRIVIYNGQNLAGPNRTTALDFIQIVPEPAAATLICFGLLGMSLRRRRA